MMGEYDNDWDEEWDEADSDEEDPNGWNQK